MLDVAGKWNRIRDAAPSERSCARMRLGVPIERAGVEDLDDGVRHVLGANDLGGVDHKANESGRQPPIDHQSRTTRYTVTGWLLFLSSIGGHSMSLGGLC